MEKQQRPAARAYGAPRPQFFLPAEGPQDYLGINI